MIDYVSIKSSTLTDIADAIIEKGGANGAMYPKDMADNIRNISGGTSTVDIPEALQYKYFIWKKIVKDESVTESTISYTGVSNSTYSEFVEWATSISGVSNIPESELDNFSTWYATVFTGDDENTGYVFQEFKYYTEKQGITVDTSLPSNTNFFINDGYYDEFEQWYNSSENHVLLIPQDIYDDFKVWYNTYYEDDKLIGEIDYVTPSSTDTLSNYTIYGGTATGVKLTSSTSADWVIGLKDADFQSTGNLFLMNAGGLDNRTTLSVYGDNTLQATSNRVFSVTGTGAYNRMIGCYEAFSTSRPTLKLIDTSTTTAALKGNWFIQDVDVELTSGCLPTSSDTEHIILVNGASYSMNGSTVSQQKPVGGDSYVDLAVGLPGTSIITTKSDPTNGYILSGYKVNGTFYSGNIVSSEGILFPSSSTLDIIPVFVESDNAKKYSFVVVSDIHLRNDNYLSGLNDFKRMCQMINNTDSDMLLIPGDIGYRNTNEERNIFKEYKGYLNSNISVYATNGNHDGTATNAEWLSTVGCELCATFTRGDDLFIFVPLSGSDAQTAYPFTDSTITWFENILSNNADKRIFAFSHFPLNNMSSDASDKWPGIASYSTYGYTSYSPQCSRIVNAISSHGNTIYITGHTHHIFEVEDDYPNNNVYALPDTAGAALVHVPSLNLPRNSSGTVIGSSEPNAQNTEGYIVDVYDDKIVFNTYEFGYRSKYQTTGTLLESYVHEIDNAAVQSIRMTALGDEVEGNSTIQVGVHLMTEGGTVNFSVPTGFTVSPASLTFTDSNRKTNQYVTITAPASYSSSTFQLTATCGTLVKTMTLTYADDGLSYNYQLCVDLSTINQNHYITCDTLYYGTSNYSGTSTGLATSSDISVLRLGFVDALLSSYDTALLLTTETTKLTVDLSGDNTFYALSSKAMSNRSQYPTVLRGHDGATLTLSTSASDTSACWKGNYIIQDLALSTYSSTGNPIDKNDYNYGVTLYDGADLTINSTSIANAKYTVSVDGDAKVGINIGYMRNGTDFISAIIPDGYTVDYTVNGVVSSTINGMDVPKSNEHYYLTAQVDGTYIHISVDTTASESSTFPKTSFSNTVDLAAQSAKLTLADDTLYYGTATSLSTRIQDLSTNTTLYHFGLDSAILSASSSPIYISNQAASAIMEVYTSAQIFCTGTSTQRCLTHSMSNEMSVIGHDDATLLLSTSNTTYPCLKGDYVFTDISVVICNPAVSCYQISSTGITLSGNSSLEYTNSSVSNSKVVLKNSGDDVGFAVNLSAFDSTPKFTAIVPDGYTVTKIVYNGNTVSDLSSIAYPGSNETLTINVIVAESSITLNVILTTAESTIEEWDDGTFQGNYTQLTLGSGATQLVNGRYLSGTYSSGYISSSTYLSVGAALVNFSHNSSSTYRLSVNSDGYANINCYGENMISSTAASSRPVSQYGDGYVTFIGHKDATLSIIGYYTSSHSQHSYSTLKGNFMISALDFTQVNDMSAWTDLSITSAVAQLSIADCGAYNALSDVNGDKSTLIVENTLSDTNQIIVSIERGRPGYSVITTSGMQTGMTMTVGTQTFTRDLVSSDNIVVPSLGNSLTIHIS